MAIDDLDKFEAAMDRESRNIVNAINFLHKHLTFYIFAGEGGNGGVVMATPVDRGRARGNWQISVGAGVDTEVEGFSTTFNPSLGQSQIFGAPNFSNIFITNNVRYIEVLELGLFDPPNPGPTKDKRRQVKGEDRVLVRGGFSTQAPGPVGFVQRQIQRAMDWWELNAQKVFDQWPVPGVANP